MKNITLHKKSKYFFIFSPRKRLKSFISNAFIILFIGVFLLPFNVQATSINNESIIKITNKVRAKNNLPPLNANQLLSKAAYDKAHDIIRTQTFAHNIMGKKFSSWIKSSGYKYSYIGENLAIGFLSTELTMDAWLKSPSHRKNILNSRFKEIGVATIQAKMHDKNEILIVQIFGEPKMSLVHLTENNKPQTKSYSLTKKDKFPISYLSALSFAPAQRLDGISINTDNYDTKINIINKQKKKNMEKISTFIDQALAFISLKTKFAYSASPISLNLYYFLIIFGLAISTFWIVWVFYRLSGTKR